MVFVVGVMILFALMRLSVRPLPLDWLPRQRLPWFLLVAPLASLAVGALLIPLCLQRAVTCFALLATCLTTIGWQTLLLRGLVAFGAMAMGAGLVALVRLGLLQWLVYHRSIVATAALQQQADALAAHLGIATPSVRLWASLRPVALVCGIRHPIILLSPWLIQHLDPRELEAVLAHESGHIARHDQWHLWLATWLRDACWYVPASHRALRSLRESQEFACDDIAVQMTKRPLALASALAKVWQAEVTTPGTPFVPALIGYEALENRITRLTTVPGTTQHLPPPRVLDEAPLCNAAITYLALLLALVGCGVMVAVNWLH